MKSQRKKYRNRSPHRLGHRFILAAGCVFGRRSSQDWARRKSSTVAYPQIVLVLRLHHLHCCRDVLFGEAVDATMRRNPFSRCLRGDLVGCGVLWSTGEMTSTAGLLISDTHTNNYFANEPEGLRHFRDHRWKALGEENPILSGPFLFRHYFESYTE